MKKSLPLLILFSSPFLVLGCAKHSDSSTSSIQSPPESRPVPALDQIKDATISVADGALYLSDYDYRTNRPILYVTAQPTSHHEVEADGSTKILVQPTLQESYASGGSGGLVRYSGSGKLEDVHLEQANAAIEAKGVTPWNRLVRGMTQDESEKLVEAAGFVPGSIWIVSIHDRGDFILAVQVGNEFAPSTDVYRSAKLRYKVLEFKLAD